MFNHGNTRIFLARGLWIPLFLNVFVLTVKCRVVQHWNYANNEALVSSGFLILGDSFLVLTVVASNPKAIIFIVIDSRFWMPWCRLIFHPTFPPPFHTLFKKSKECSSSTSSKRAVTDGWSKPDNLYCRRDLCPTKICRNCI